MFVRKLLKNQNHNDYNVHVNMTNIDTNVQENSNHVIIMDAQADTGNPQSEQVCIYVHIRRRTF